MKTSHRSALALAYVAIAALAPAAARAQGVPSPECKAAPVPAAWTRSAQNAFAISLPEGATFARPALSIDFESGTWTWGDGRIVRYQYGFAVDGLEGLAGDSSVSVCTVTRGNRAIRYYTFRTDAGEYAWGFHIPELVAYYPSTGTLVDGLTVLGFGGTVAVQDEGLAVLRSLAFSKIPEAASGLYQTTAAAQGVSVHVAGGVAGVVWGTYEPGTGKPMWLTGVGDRAEVAYHAPSIDGDSSARYVAVPLAFFRSTGGTFPGSTGVAPDVKIWATGELRFRDDCATAELEFRTPDGESSGVLPLTRLTDRVGDCSRF